MLSLWCSISSDSFSSGHSQSGCLATASLWVFSSRLDGWWDGSGGQIAAHLFLASSFPPPSSSTSRKRLVLTCPSSHEHIDYGPSSFRPRVDINLCSRSPLAATWPAIRLCTPDPAAGNLICHQPQETTRSTVNIFASFFRHPITCCADVTMSRLCLVCVFQLLQCLEPSRFHPTRGSPKMSYCFRALAATWSIAAFDRLPAPRLGYEMHISHQVVNGVPGAQQDCAFRVKQPFHCVN